MRCLKFPAVAAVLLASYGYNLQADAAVRSYAVVVSESTWAEPEWRAVAEELAKKHPAKVIRYEKSLVEAKEPLQKVFPSHICFVARPAEASRAFVAQVHQLTRALDDDPYPDCLWGVLTGLDARDALQIAKNREPLTVRKVASGTPIPLERCEAGVWYSELDAGKFARKEAGQAALESIGPVDSTEVLTKTLTEWNADAFITSGHATEREWQIGYRYRNGYFKSEEGRLYGEDTKGRKLPIKSPNPKVYLPIGNCLMGHIDGTNAMALAFMHSGGVQQMLGYTVETWYGYAGWGCLDYFLEQPGRFTFAEAFIANQAALVHRLATYFPEAVSMSFDAKGSSRPNIRVGEAAREARLGQQDGLGLLFDRDVLAFYGDPGWEARLAPGKNDWEQTLTEQDGRWTLKVQPKSGPRSFAAVDQNGSQRGGRPFVQFFPKRLKDIVVLVGAELRPVITDTFILVPNSTQSDGSTPLVIEFSAKPML